MTMDSPCTFYQCLSDDLFAETGLKALLGWCSKESICLMNEGVIVQTANSTLSFVEDIHYELKYLILQSHLPTFFKLLLSHSNGLN